MESTNLYINKCKSYIDFMITQQQWSGISKAEVGNWLRNFESLPLDELTLVYKLLTNIVYFSEADVIDALRQGVDKCLCYDVILKRQCECGFSLSQHALSNIRKDELNKACFVPLLSSGAPHESGNYVSRVLVQQGIIHSSQSMFADRLPDCFKSGSISHLVIVDDCVGSGDQLRGFWENTIVFNGETPLSLKKLCENYNVVAHYLTLFGYEESIQELSQELSGLKLHCVRILNNSLRVFSENSYVWKDDQERLSAFRLFSNITRDAGIPLYGYKGFDFAFIMHKTIPDWTLPLFWKENTDWSLLMRRKNSNE